jgi:hypothetical protein
MLDEPIILRPTDARRARTTVRKRMAERGIDNEHIAVVEAVVAELLGATIESGLQGSARLMLESFPLLTSVRLRCPRDVDVRDEPWGLRDRVLERLTTAAGKRANADGTTDLFAEIPRPA